MRRRPLIHEIDPDEIFLDASNLPNFDTDQFEGRIERPIARRSLIALTGLFTLVVAVLVGKLWMLQVVEGKVYAERSEQNRLEHSILFAERGVLYDRRGKDLAWNIPGTDGFPFRAYAKEAGLAHLVGYLSYPRKDSAGVYYDETFVGRAGAEAAFDDVLAGENGLKIVETDAGGTVRSESVIRPPRNGRNVTLAADARVTSRLFEEIASLARRVGFEGGAGVLMDVTTGEILALASYPEYDQNILTSGKPAEAVRGYVTSSRKPFLNRIVAGLYTPGSIVKLFIAAGALEEGIITPEKTIVSTGSITVPNPFVPGTVSVFNDWRAHGAVNMRQALAVSSNVYFFEIGGGYEEQAGLGIKKIEEYARYFGLGSATGIELSGEQTGTIPSPAWKREYFEDGLWRIGDTYNTAIGQYGFQVTPIQMARAVAAFANGGILLTPSITTGSGRGAAVPVAPEHLGIVREGMRQAVTKGTAGALSLPGISVAAKTGTAELGITKQFVNSWVVGFFPYEEPRYAFAIVMEHGPRANLVGAASVARELLSWMRSETPEYLTSP